MLNFILERHLSCIRSRYAANAAYVSAWLKVPVCRNRRYYDYYTYFIFFSLSLSLFRFSKFILVRKITCHHQVLMHETNRAAGQSRPTGKSHASWRLKREITTPGRNSIYQHFLIPFTFDDRTDRTRNGPVFLRENSLQIITLSWTFWRTTCLVWPFDAINYEVWSIEAMESIDKCKYVKIYDKNCDKIFVKI